jgi:hypothetical protein
MLLKFKGASGIRTRIAPIKFGTTVGMHVSLSLKTDAVTNGYDSSSIPPLAPHRVRICSPTSADVHTQSNFKGLGRTPSADVRAHPLAPLVDLLAGIPFLFRDASRGRRAERHPPVSAITS